MFDKLVGFLGKNARSTALGIFMLFGAVGNAGVAVFDNDAAFDKVIYIVMTDGEENSSTQWRKDTIHTLVDTKLQSGNVTFQYMGAQPESWDDAAKIGLGAAALQYDQSNYVGTYAVMSSSINEFSKSNVRSSMTMTKDFGNADLLRAANLKVDKD